MVSTDHCSRDHQLSGKQIAVTRRLVFANFAVFVAPCLCAAGQRAQIFCTHAVKDVPRKVHDDAQKSLFVKPASNSIDFTSIYRSRGRGEAVHSLAGWVLSNFSGREKRSLRTMQNGSIEQNLLLDLMINVVQAQASTPRRNTTNKFSTFHCGREARVEPSAALSPNSEHRRSFTSD